MAEQQDWGQRAAELAGSEAIQVGPAQWLVHDDCFRWLGRCPPQAIHGVVTDPPYGLSEYDRTHHDKLRAGRGGLWRIPPTLDGVTRRPVPRFTVLSERDKELLEERFNALARVLSEVLTPGGHLLMASNPLVSSRVFSAIELGGLDKRGEVIRLVTTLRGGDRPKGAHEEFDQVTVMPRSGWEPWGLFRSPLEGTVANTLRRWGTGGLRRTSESSPFRDVLQGGPARGPERACSEHPSLKPQRLMRPLVRALLPMEQGIVVDPFAGSGSTLAAARALGIPAIGIERDAAYVAAAVESIPKLAALEI